MERRNFLKMSAVLAATASMNLQASASSQIDSAWYRRNRKFVALPMGKVAYVEHGHGPAALFIHGYPLNGYQWRGALERLHGHRRCIAPDVLGMGYSQAHDTKAITPPLQAEMLAALLDRLHVDSVDLVANDSGGLLAQLFIARYPQRVRSLLLTNCDVDENSPPPQFLPFIELAREGKFVDQTIMPQLKNKDLARSAEGLGGVAYTYPQHLSDETIDAYFRPMVASAVSKAQVNQYAASMKVNYLPAIREDLHRWKGAARMVWGMKDELFPVKWAEWLDRTLPGSRGIRRVEGANLFFPEEMPELIAEEAEKLWTGGGDVIPEKPRVSSVRDTAL